MDYLWHMCGENLKRINHPAAREPINGEIEIVSVQPITQENLDKMFTREKYTVNDINELIDRVSHISRHRDAAYDEVMYFVDERYPSLEEDFKVERTNALFEFIEGHLELE